MPRSSSLPCLDDLNAGARRLAHHQASRLSDSRSTTLAHPRSRDRTGWASTKKKGVTPASKGRHVPFRSRSQSVRSGSSTGIGGVGGKKRKSLPWQVSRGPSPTAYACCGRFAVDLAELCRERQVFRVPQVVVLPASAEPKVEIQEEETVSKDMTSKRKSGPRTGGARSSQPVSSATTVDSATSAPSFYQTSLSGRGEPDHPSTPLIQVEQEDPDDDSTVCTVGIRGWRVGRGLMEVLYQCWPRLPALRCLTLTQAGVQGSIFYLLASCLPLLPHLRSLVLDANPLADVSLSALLGRGRPRPPWHLSLRFCGIGDLQVQDLAGSLGAALSTPDVTASTFLVPADEGLASLNLSNNVIGDRGVTHLAEALKSNRGLHVLNLAHNRMGDVGVARLAQVLAWFPLTPHQEKVRRVLFHGLLEEKVENSGSLSESQQSQPEHSANKDTRLRSPSPRCGSVPSVSNWSPPPRKSSLSHKRDGSPSTLKMGGSSSHRKMRVTFSFESEMGNGRKYSVEQEPEPEEEIMVVPRSSPVDKLRYRPSWYTEENLAVGCLGPHPFLRAGFLREGALWLPGNRAVISLNVSGNRIGRAGVRALLQTVEEQMLPAQDGKPGLLRLVMHRNPVPADCPEVQELRHRMRRKEPGFYCSRINLSRGWIVPCAMPVSALL